MSEFEFKFVVNDVELSEEGRERISRAIAEAGLRALGEDRPAEAGAFIFPHHIYCGLPPYSVVVPEPEREEV